MPRSRATLLPILLSPLLSTPVHAATASASSAALHAIQQQQQQPSAAFLSSSTSSSLPTRSIRTFSQSPNNNHLYSILNAQCPTRSRPHSTMSSSSSSTPENTNKTPTQPQSETTSDAPPNINSEEYLALPDASSSAGATKLDISEGGSTVKLDHMGPLVVNQDGSLSRIANWDQMAEIEKKNTLRVLGKRNKARLEALKKAGAGAGEGN